MNAVIDIIWYRSSHLVRVRVFSERCRYSLLDEQMASWLPGSATRIGSAAPLPVYRVSVLADLDHLKVEHHCGRQVVPFDLEWVSCHWPEVPHIEGSEAQGQDHDRVLAVQRLEEAVADTCSDHVVAQGLGQFY